MHPYREAWSEATPLGSSRRWLLVFPALALFAAGTAAIFAMRSREADDIAVPPAPIVTDLRREPKIIYEAAWPGWEVTLVGLDRVKKEVVLELVSDEATPALAFDTIAWETGERTSHWLASDETAFARSRQNHAPHFDVKAPDFAYDLRTIADFVGRASHGEPVPYETTPAVALSPTGAILFEQSDASDTLWLAGADGMRARRVDSGLVASYGPVFSPDGSIIAVDAWPGGAENYALYLLDAAGTKPPVRVGKVDHPKAHFFMDGGRSIVALARPGTSDKHAELWRVPVEHPADAVLFYRDDEMHGADLFAASNGTAVLGVTGRAVWFDVASGAILHSMAKPDMKIASVGPDGRAFACDTFACVVHDPKTDRDDTIALAGGWGVRGAAWGDASTILVLEARTGQGWSPLHYRIRRVPVH